MPNARRLGFTGTPVSLGGADTVDVFGDYIHTYDIRQAQEDRATVPIFYTARQAKLHLSDADVDAALKELTESASDGEEINLERRKSRWAAFAAAAGARDRLWPRLPNVSAPCEVISNSVSKKMPNSKNDSESAALTGREVPFPAISTQNPQP